MRPLINLAIFCTLVAGGLLAAIVIPESKKVVDDLLVSYPNESKEWLARIAAAPFQWAFYLSATLALLLWIRPQKRPHVTPTPNGETSEQTEAAARWIKDRYRKTPTAHATGQTATKPEFATECPRCGLPQTGIHANCQQCSLSLASSDVESFLAKEQRARQSSTSSGKAFGCVVAVLIAACAITFAAYKLSNKTTNTIPEDKIRIVIANAYDDGSRAAAKTGRPTEREIDQLTVDYATGCLELLGGKGEPQRSIASAAGISFGIGMHAYHSSLEPPKPAHWSSMPAFPLCLRSWARTDATT